MTHDELLAKIDAGSDYFDYPDPHRNALRRVVELHKPITNWAGTFCKECGITIDYPCPTIQAIEKELQ